MSPNLRGNVRIAIGNLLRREWKPDNVEGYVLGEDIGLHLGYYDEERPFPQIALTQVSSTALGNNGKVGWDPSGAGHVHEYRGRIDVNIFTGTADDMEGGGSPDLLATTVGEEIREILHAARTLPDPETGDVLCTDIGPVSEPINRVDTDGAMGEYSSTVEAQYLRMKNPPERGD